MMVVGDANAIGDFYTCASLLKEPVRTKLRTVIHDYTSLRVDLAKRRYEESEPARPRSYNSQPGADPAIAINCAGVR
jgi:hypothetical protein